MLLTRVNLRPRAPKKTHASLFKVNITPVYLHIGKCCTYHHLQGLLTSHPRVVCGHLSERLLQRLRQQHHRAQHGDYAEHQAAVEPGERIDRAVASECDTINGGERWGKDTWRFLWKSGPLVH